MATTWQSAGATKITFADNISTVRIELGRRSSPVRNLHFANTVGKTSTSSTFVKNSSRNSAPSPQRPPHTTPCRQQGRSPEVSWKESSVFRSLQSCRGRAEWALGAHDSVSEVKDNNSQTDPKTEPLPTPDTTSDTPSDTADVSTDVSTGNGAGPTAQEGLAEAVVKTVSSVGELIELGVKVMADNIADLANEDVANEDGLTEQERATAISTVAFWVGAAVVFGVGVGVVEGPPKASEFFAGYILEQSLSVDNLLVFVIVFDYFKVPPAYQPRVLTYGIAGAIIFRGIMIGLGVATIQSFSFVNLIFAAILIFSSYKLLAASDEEESDDLSDNAIVKFCRRFIPVTSDYDENKFYTVVDGVQKVDSIPAVFGVTRDPLIVFTSNIFAILGLRSLYVLVASSVGDLEYLQPAVALVLGFIGVKIIAEFFDFPIPTEYSLLIVGSVLGGGVALSLNKKREDEEKEKE